MRKKWILHDAENVYLSKEKITASMTDTAVSKHVKQYHAYQLFQAPSLCVSMHCSSYLSQNNEGLTSHKVQEIPGPQ